MPRWSTVASDELLWCGWSGEYALYHRPSGKTHFVNEAARLLLSQLLREPRSLDEVVAGLARLQGLAPDEGLTGHVAALLLRFEALGLIERA